MFELLFADSELLALRWQDGTLVLAFAAAHVMPLDPRLGDGAGHVSHLALHLAEARLRGDARSAFGRVADGHWQRDEQRGEPRGGQRRQRTMTVPQTTQAAVQLSLALANGTQLEIEAAALQAVFSGEPGFRESMAC